ncbi:MAG TPA: D-aminoacyl-tRNA deacylase [Erysipelotrichaceae bacterium]|jgi:D-tyrosyl-tRNA(Tyr) deacylase|nr:D-aminoacyl-tRNA deacylase [Erysipelotrichaceae bacterium]HQA84378.1 D-aminoacyl-tRNA deacylase [Erysipelotrichaceae bacterium]
MKIVIQRVKSAAVKIGGKQYSSINVGYLLLIGFSYSDDEDILLPMAKKLLELRINEDSQGKMNLSIIDIGGEILSVSQFTLYADCKKGRRPSFTNACPADKASQLYDKFNDILKESGLKVETGLFQAFMEVELINDGPVTVILDSDIILKR